MTTEERIARIETALIAAGLMDPPDAPTKEEALRDLRAGDNTTIQKYLVSEFGKGNRPFTIEGRKTKRNSNGKRNGMPSV